MEGTLLLGRPWFVTLYRVILGGVLGLCVGYNLGLDAAHQNPTIAVQMYVMSVDDGADVASYRIEQAGDQFTYQLSEHVMQNIQQSPTFVNCIDGLAISSVWTQFAEEASCDSPAIHVVLIAPY
jgi:hypothetical protein